MSNDKHQTQEPGAAHGSLPPDANADLKGSQQAIRRAAQKARELAQQTGTDLIVQRTGQIVRVHPAGKASA